MRPTLQTQQQSVRSEWRLPIGLIILFLAGGWTAPHTIAQTPVSHDVVWRAAFSSDGDKVVVMDGKRLRILAVKTGNTLQVLEGHEFTPYAVTFSPDGKRILSGDGNCLRLWDVQTGKQLLKLGARNGNLSSLAISPDGCYAVSSHSFGSGIQLVPPRDLFLWNLETGKVVCHERIILHRWLTQHLFSAYYELLPENLRELLPCIVLDLFEGATCREVCRFEGQKHVNCASFSPDGKRVILGCEDGTTRILEVATGREVYSLGGPGKGVRGVAFSADGRRVLAGTESGAVYLWCLRGKAEEGCLRAHKGAVYSVAFSPDGRRALSGGEDQTVRLWHLGTGKELACFRGLKAAVQHENNGRGTERRGQTQTTPNVEPQWYQD